MNLHSDQPRFRGSDSSDGEAQHPTPVSSTNFQHLWNASNDSVSEGRTTPDANAGPYADNEARSWTEPASSSYCASNDAGPILPPMQPTLMGRAPSSKWPTLASTIVAIVLATLSLATVFTAIGQIATDSGTTGTYVRLGLFPLVVAASAFFLYVKSRARARKDPRGPDVGRLRHRRTSTLVAIAVVAVALGLGLAGSLINSARDEASYQAGRENGEIQGRTYVSATSAGASDGEIRARCKTAAEITSGGRYWAGGYIPVADLDVDDFVDGCFQTYRALAPR